MKEVVIGSFYTLQVTYNCNSILRKNHLINGIGGSLGCNTERVVLLQQKTRNAVDHFSAVIHYRVHSVVSLREDLNLLIGQEVVWIHEYIFDLLAQFVVLFLSLSSIARLVLVLFPYSYALIE